MTLFTFENVYMLGYVLEILKFIGVVYFLKIFKQLQMERKTL